MGHQHMRAEDRVADSCGVEDRAPQDTRGVEAGNHHTLDDYALEVEIVRSARELHSHTVVAVCVRDTLGVSNHGGARDDLCNRHNLLEGHGHDGVVGSVSDDGRVDAQVGS